MFRILIVDDEPIARQVLREELDAFGDVAIIGEAESGGVAIDLIQRLTPDLGFLDLQMPVLGGLEVIRAVSAGPPAIIVVAACENDGREALRAGAIGYLLKPVGPSCLRRAIEQLRQIPSISGTRPITPFFPSIMALEVHVPERFGSSSPLDGTISSFRGGSVSVAENPAPLV